MKTGDVETLFVRIPRKLKRALEAAAKADQRSLNAYVERVLAAHVQTLKGAQ